MKATIWGTGFGLLAMSWAAALTAQTLPEFEQAFGPGKPGAGAVVRGDGLFRVDVPLEQYPEALCADGSHAVFYTRAASTRAHRDDWVIYLQGGGSCDSGQDCYDRWRGQDGNFGANKLSSSFAPRGGIKAGGIENRRADNPFASWNHVFVYYCSSDAWTGQVADVALNAEHRGEQVEYRAHFQGAKIINAVVDMLQHNAGPLSYLDNEGRRQRMPDLDAASTVLFAGSSAGGSGVRSNADRLGDHLRANNLRCDAEGCPLRYAAVIDASYGLSREILDHADSRACGEALIGACSYELSMRHQWEIVQRGLRQGLSDQSCVAFHRETEDQWRCADGVHLLKHHLQTPFFARVDLQDRLVMGNTIEAGYRYQGVELDRALYGALEEIQLRELAINDQLAEEPRAPGPLEPPGVFGPQCGDHETLRSNQPTYQRAIVADGQAYQMLELLQNWLNGDQPSAVIENFDPEAMPASCQLQNPG